MDLKTNRVRIVCLFDGEAEARVEMGWGEGRMKGGRDLKYVVEVTSFCMNASHLRAFDFEVGMGVGGTVEGQDTIQKGHICPLHFAFASGRQLLRIQGSHFHRVFQNDSSSTFQGQVCFLERGRIEGRSVCGEERTGMKKGTNWFNLSA